MVLGFPSNDFGAQEPGSPAEIRKFITDRFGVTFPVFEKLVTKEGPDQSPLYALLKQATNELPSWNFCKYLVARDGTPLKFYKSSVKPEDVGLRADISAALAKK